MANEALKRLKPQQWDERKAKHLLSRAGFGIPRERVTQLARIGVDKAVDSLVDYQSIPAYGDEPTFLIPPFKYRDLRDIEDEQERRNARNMVQREERQAVQTLKQWWIERILNSPRPLEEKMTLFWHGHFASSAQKVKSSAANYQMHAEMRKHATGNVKGLTVAIAHAPAMLNYLDNNKNVKQHPNENWARELMELFTLGIGNYTEDDIKESARAFTGWRISPKGLTVIPRLHDSGSKTFLGRTGNFGGMDIIDIIFEQPAAAEFISKKLFLYFVQDQPDEAVIQAMASQLRASNYELAPVLKTLFLSEAFYSDTAIGTQIKSPVQFVAQLAHDLDIKHPPYATMAQASAQLGQDLFYPPNVKGWDGGRAWINANTLLTRYNLHVALASANGQKEGMMMEARMDGGAEMMDPQAMMQRTRGEAEAYMKSLPPQQQQKLRRKMQEMETPKDRQQYMMRLLEKSKNYEFWNAKQVFDDFEFTKAGECVDALADRFLARPASMDQKTLIAEALGVEGGLNAPLALEDLSEVEMNAALRLLLSTAEYQLA